MVQDYSDWLRVKSDIGNSQTVYDVLTGTLAKASLGIIWSNGNRHSFLRYKATTVEACLNSAYVGNTAIALTGNIPVVTSLSQDNLVAE
jgi:hypothetical protein